MTQINVDAYLVDCLLPDLVGHDRRLSSFIVYLYLYRHASKDAKWSVRISHQSIATATGLSRSAVQPRSYTFRLANSSRLHVLILPPFPSTASCGLGCVSTVRGADSTRVQPRRKPLDADPLLRGESRNNTIAIQCTWRINPCQR